MALSPGLMRPSLRAQRACVIAGCALSLVALDESFTIDVTEILKFNLDKCNVTFLFFNSERVHGYKLVFLKGAWRIGILRIRAC